MIKHLRISKDFKKSIWRKNSIQNWKLNNDSSTYVNHSLPIDSLLEYSKNNSTNPFFIFIKIVSLALKDVPDANTILHRGKVHYRESQNIFIHVIEDRAMEELSGYVIYNPVEKPISQLSAEISSDLNRIKNGESFFKATQKISNYLPGFLIKLSLKLSGFLLYFLNINLTPKLIPKDCFGSIMISNVGSVGLESAFIPLVSFSRAHLAMSYGKVLKRLILQDNKPIEQSYINLGFTFDHRVMDGIHLAKLIERIEFYIENINEID